MNSVKIGNQVPRSIGSCKIDDFYISDTIWGPNKCIISVYNT